MAVADEAPGGLGATLVSRLQGLREAVLWKVEGVEEYDLRRPLTPTGTNLLGLVWMIVETARHAGHMDILRESLDGTAGLVEGNDNLAHPDAVDRATYVTHLEKVARDATGIGQA